MLFRSIKSKMMFVFGVFILLLIGVSFGVSYLKTQSIFTDALLLTAPNMAFENSTSISRWVKDIEEQLKIIVKANQTLNFDENEKTAFLKILINNKNEATSYYIADSSGNASFVDRGVDIVAGTSQNISKTDYFKTTMEEQKMVISKPFIDPRNDTQVISVAVPIIESGRSKGIVGVNVSLSYLQDVVKGMKVNEKGYGWIIDKDLNTIAHPQDKYLGNKEVFKEYGENLKHLKRTTS